MNNAPVTGVKACVFDAFGTLFDFAAAAKGCRDVLGDEIDKVTALWRDRLGLPAEAIAFQSSNAWDAYAASAFGMQPWRSHRRSWSATRVSTCSAKS